jgi:predicted metalloprotease with PDZ domain
LLAGGLLLAATAPRADADTEARVAEEIEATLLRLIESGLLREHSGKTLDVKREARVRYELGAVVDIDADADSATVVAITPGGSAERMALQVGDRIIAINGLNLAKSDDLGGDFALQAARAQGELLLTVRRDSREFEVRGRAEQVLLPGFRLRIDLPELPDPP